jgi:hypothetical protein
MTEATSVPPPKSKLSPGQHRARMRKYQCLFRVKQRAKAKAAEEIAAAKEETEAATARYLAHPHEDARHLAQAAVARVQELEAVLAALSAARPKAAPWRERHPEESKALQRAYQVKRKARAKARRLAEATQAKAAALERVRAVECLRLPECLGPSPPDQRVASAELAALRAAARGEAKAAAKRLLRLTARPGHIPS